MRKKAGRAPFDDADLSWALAQEWHHVLFLHWPVDAAVLRALVPAPLDIETRDDRAYITVLPFAMRRLRPRGLPALPWLSSFPQLNIRTYVTLDGRPGVFLLRVAVGSRLAVTIARRLFGLPCERARLALRKEGEGWVFACRSRAGERLFMFSVRYRPEGPVFQPAPGSLEHWLTERFCYYAAGRDGRVGRGEIEHPPWSLQAARVNLTESVWPAAFGIESGGTPPLAFYSRRQEAFAWLPERVARLR